jgi:uncharacterized OB-fold protein
MPVYEYRGQRINIPDNDTEHKGYFEAAREHRLVLKRCLDCGLLRGEPGAGCPWCPSQRSEWHTVSGKGAIYSYQIVAHTVIPGFKDWAPFPIVLVELDEQRGHPTPDDGLRITANLLNDKLEPENEERVAIGKRVEAIFVEVTDGLTLPQFKLAG